MHNPNESRPQVTHNNTPNPGEATMKIKVEDASPNGIAGDLNQAAAIVDNANMPNLAVRLRAFSARIDELADVAANSQAHPGGNSAREAKLDRLCKILDTLTDSQHGEDCKAYGSEPDADCEDKNTEIDDNPSDFLEKCDCGLKEAFEGWKIAKELREALPPESQPLEKLEQLAPESETDHPKRCGNCGNLWESHGQTVEGGSVCQETPEELRAGAESETAKPTPSHSMLTRAALKGWKRGRRNQDPEAEVIANLILSESRHAQVEDKPTPGPCWRCGDTGWMASDGIRARCPEGCAEPAPKVDSPATPAPMDKREGTTPADADALRLAELVLRRDDWPELDMGDLDVLRVFPRAEWISILSAAKAIMERPANEVTPRDDLREAIKCVLESTLSPKADPNWVADRILSLIPEAARTEPSPDNQWHCREHGMYEANGVLARCPTCEKTVHPEAAKLVESLVKVVGDYWMGANPAGRVAKVDAAKAALLAEFSRLQALYLQQAEMVSKLVASEIALRSELEALRTPTENGFCVVMRDESFRQAKEAAGQITRMTRDSELLVLANKIWRICGEALGNQSEAALSAPFTQGADPVDSRSINENWAVIEALNRVSLIDIMLDAGRAGGFAHRISAHTLDAFAKAIRSHFAAKAIAAPEAPQAPAPEAREAVIAAAMDITRAWYAGKRIGDEYLSAIYRTCAEMNPKVKRPEADKGGA